MPVSKAYLDYLVDSVSSLVYSPSASVCSLSKHVVLSPVNDKLVSYSFKTKQKHGICLEPQKHQKEIAEDMLIVSAVAKSTENVIAVGYSDGSVRVFENNGIDEITATTGFSTDSIVTFNGHKSSVSTLCWLSPNTLVSGSKDTEVLVWDILSRQGLARFSGHLNEVTCITAISEDIICSGSKDGLIKLWNIKTGLCTQTINIGDEVYSICNITGNILFIGGKSTRIAIYSVDGTTNDQLKLNRYLDREVTNGYINNLLSLSINGNNILLSHANNSKRVDMYKITVSDSGLKIKLVYTYISEDRIHSLDITDQYMHMGLSNNTLVSLKITAGNDIACDSRVVIGGYDGHRNSINNIDLSYDNSLLLSTSTIIINIYSVSDMNCIRQITVQDTSDTISACLWLFNSNHMIIYTVKDTSDIYIMNINTDQVKTTSIALSGAHLHPISSGNNQFLVYSGNQIGVISVSDKTGDVSMDVEMVETIDVITSLAVGKDKIAVSLLNSTIQILYMDTLKMHLLLYGHNLPVLSMVFNSTGSILYTGGHDKTFKLWNIVFGNVLKSIRIGEIVTGIVNIPESGLFFVGTKDGNLKYIDTELVGQGVVIKEYKHLHLGEINRIVMGVDGDKIFTAGTDKSIVKIVREGGVFYLDDEKERKEILNAEKDLSAENNVVFNKVSKKTVQSVRTTEKLIDLIANSESIKIAKFLGMIPAADLPEVLMGLPVSVAKKLLESLLELLEDFQGEGGVGGVVIMPLDVIVNAGLTLVQIQARYLIAEPDINMLIVKLKVAVNKVIEYRRNKCGLGLAGVERSLLEINRKRQRVMEK
jgi:U3 small nucleolar RNA-associated protein 12